MDYFFWITLGLIALFYVLKGNDMHKEKIDLIKQNSEIKKQKTIIKKTIVKKKKQTNF